MVSLVEYQSSQLRVNRSLVDTDVSALRETYQKTNRHQHSVLAVRWLEFFGVLPIDAVLLGTMSPACFLNSVEDCCTGLETAPTGRGGCLPAAFNWLFLSSTSYLWAPCNTNTWSNYQFNIIINKLAHCFWKIKDILSRRTFKLSTCKPEINFLLLWVKKF